MTAPVLTPERVSELLEEFEQFGDRYIVDSGGMRSGHHTLLTGELRALLLTAQRVEQALQADREHRSYTQVIAALRGDA